MDSHRRAISNNALLAVLSGPLLIAEALAFFLVSARCGWVYIVSSLQAREASTSSRRRRILTRRAQSRHAGGGSADRNTEGEGVRWRRMVLGMLCFACFTRSVVTALLVTRSVWVPYLAVPDVAYLGMYGVMCFFMAQIVAGGGGRGFVRTYRYQLIAMGSLVAVLLMSLAVCMLSWGAGPETRKSALLRTALYYELGVTYMVLLAAFTYYGSRVCIATWTMSKDAFYRMLLLSSICGLALLSKGSFFVVAAANNWRTISPSPTMPRRFCLEALLALEELLPSLAILVLTEKRKASSPTRRPALLISHPSDLESDSEFAPYMNSLSLVSTDALSPGSGLTPTNSYGATSAATYTPV